ncbi:hypothetical protein [Actinomyces wuliandei]|uniref:hypothetical protein n=1 Tax=Actinomyces wuliandei TaxID=2057743 RepID=UPI000FD8664D
MRACLWRGLARARAHDHPSLETVLCGPLLRNPVGLVAGFDKNIELTPLMEDRGFGFSTGGSVTLPPRAGNPRPWFYQLPRTRSLVIHAGMANKGLVELLRRGGFTSTAQAVGADHGPRCLVRGGGGMCGPGCQAGPLASRGRRRTVRWSVSLASGGESLAVPDPVVAQSPRLRFTHAPARDPGLSES